MQKDYILKDGVLYHHGIKGQKWGIRRFQNPDGSLTEEGRRRYGTQERADYASLTWKQKRDVKKYEKNQRTNAGKKATLEYKKATDYADKHNIDADDVVYKDERSKFIRESKKEGNWEKIGKHVIEYNKMLDIAEIKDKKYYEEAKEMTKKYIAELAKINRSNLYVAPSNTNPSRDYLENNPYILKDGSSNNKNTFKLKYDPRDHGINPKVNAETRQQREEYKDAYDTLTGSVAKRRKYEQKYGRPGNI